MNIEIKSNEFTTQSEMTKAVKKIKEDVCNQLGVTREQMRFPNGLITLYGLTEDNYYLPITNIIGDFKDKIKNKSFSKFYVYCNVITK